MPISKQFWDGKRWNGHEAFHTVSHIHVSCFSPSEGFDTCDIMAVECKDGRWYVEDNWGDDAKGACGVWNPFDANDVGPTFFSTENDAIRHAVSVVAAVSGVSEAELLGHYLES